MASKMFEFVTCTWNPLGGECLHRCSYCWARKLAERHGQKKYSGQPRIVEHELARENWKNGDFVFVQDMSDLFGQWVPEDLIRRVLERVRSSYADFLFLTKNPQRYLEVADILPKNAVLGCTIESDLYRAEITFAPDPFVRLDAMRLLADCLPNRLFISIEPVMRFSSGFAEWLLGLPRLLWAVAVGYDNYDCGLPEPSLADVEWLIAELEKKGVRVYRKTLREAHNP